MRNKKIMLFIMFFICLWTVSVHAVGCEDVIGLPLINILKNDLFIPIKIITPILLLVFTTLDFAKVVFSGEKDGINKALNRFLKRAIATLVVFFAPDIIELILSLINTRNMSACLNQIK